MKKHILLTFFICCYGMTASIEATNFRNSDSSFEIKLAKDDEDGEDSGGAEDVGEPEDTGAIESEDEESQDEE